MRKFLSILALAAILFAAAAEIAEAGCRGGRGKLFGGRGHSARGCASGSCR